MLTAIRPDGIPETLIKGCYNSLSEPLYNIFNISVENGVYAKRCYITPANKNKRNRCSVENYKPITIICTKIL